VGARPQFIKAAPVSRALADCGLDEFLLHTGQHYDPNMSAVFFEELGLRPPDCCLNVGSGTHAAQTASMLTGVEDAIRQQAPHGVLVYGDTNSTLAGVLAAAKLHVPVAHVEAGLRSFNRRMPEEVNRVVADVLSDTLFAPTDTAVRNLRAEGLPEQRIVRTGDVMYDATLLFRERARGRSSVLQHLGLEDRGFALATIHRPENTDSRERLEAILGGLAAIAGDLPVVFPLHPRTRLRLAALKPADAPDLLLCDPVGYLDMMRLEMSAAVIVTDSGGVQKEAFFHRCPCVTLRDETEWTELIEAGWNRLCPPVSASAVASAVLAARDTRGEDVELYGDGHSARVIARTLRSRIEAPVSPPAVLP
jgi:UDP-GlcNAc3NAcA epimerase